MQGRDPTNGEPRRRGLGDRLKQGPVIAAEGYLFALERRGYISAGPFVPTVVLEHPEVVSQLHRDFVHAGSDVVVAFTYYGHREKLRTVGKEDLLEPLNRQALGLAKEVAMESGALFAGNICNTNMYDPHDPRSLRECRAMFEEQVGWAKEAGVDFIVAETFSWEEEALLAQDVIQAHGLASVVTMAAHRNPLSREGRPMAEVCQRLEQAGAEVVGLNCMRGPDTMLPLIAEIAAKVKSPVAALPVPYRTTEAEPTFQSLTDPGCHCIPGDRPFPTALDPFTCNRYEIAEFTEKARAAGVQYFGLCCGAEAHHLREMALALGREPAAAQYAPDMSRHSFYGTDLRDVNVGYKEEL
jgi:betaine-homocysteine S-methyltransferase